jgi:hypothetical protein
MPLRTVVLLVVLALIALFAALNWTAFVAPTTLSFGVAQVQVILEWRRHAKELQTQRELADQAEASRFTELRTHVDTRLTEIESSLSAQLGEMRDRFQR